VDRTLNTSELASTLVTDMGTAGAEMERSLRSESAAEGTH